MNLGKSSLDQIDFIKTPKQKIKRKKNRWKKKESPYQNIAQPGWNKARTAYKMPF